MGERVEIGTTEAVSEAFEEYAREQITASFKSHIEEFLANDSIDNMTLFSGLFLPQDPPSTEIHNGRLIFEVPKDPKDPIKHILYGDLDQNLINALGIYQAGSVKVMPKVDRNINLYVSGGTVLFNGLAEMEVSKFMLKGAGNYIAVVERYVATSKLDQSFVIDHWMARRINLGGPKISDNGPTSVGLFQELVAV